MTLKKIVLVTSLSMAPVLLLGQGQGSAPGQGRTVQPPAAPSTAKPAPRPPARAAASAPTDAGLDPADVLKPLSDSWPTYSGDMTGRRYSSLTQVNQNTVKNLTLAWTSRLVAGSGHRVLLPLSLLFGGAFLVLADLAARTIVAPAELPIGVITAFVGAPFFALVLHTSRRYLR